MKTWQFLMLLGFILIHLYWTSPRQPLPALAFGGLLVAAGPFTFVSEKAAKK